MCFRLYFLSHAKSQRRKEESAKRLIFLFRELSNEETIGGFITFMKKNGILGFQKSRQYLIGLEGISLEQIEAYQAQAIEAEKFASGGIKAISAAGAAGQSAFMMATLFGTASTGTAISGLSGAALTNATLAWLGGGSLAAGGGGMALGTIVLGGITIAPALAISGFVLANQGEKALTKVAQYEAKVNTEIAKIKAAQDFLQQIKNRTWELRDLVDQLNYRALESLQKLENKPFNLQQDVKEFQSLALLIKALSEIITIPILDNKGDLNYMTKKIQAKYSNI